MTSTHYSIHEPPFPKLGTTPHAVIEFGMNGELLTYEGPLKDGKFHGKGLLKKTIKGTIIHQGEFINGKPSDGF